MMRKQNPATPGSVARCQECRQFSSIQQILALVEAALKEHNIVPYSIRLSLNPVVEGALFDLSGQRPAWPDGSSYAYCYIAFVDPIEAHDYEHHGHSKWAHPAWFAFVPALGEGPVLVSPSDFPPHPDAPNKRPIAWEEVLTQFEPPPAPPERSYP